MGGHSSGGRTIFQAWSDAVCNNEKPPIEFPVDCLVGRYALLVVYYVAGWTLFSMSKASTVAADNRPVCFTFAASQTIDERAGKEDESSVISRGEEETAGIGLLFTGIF